MAEAKKITLAEVKQHNTGKDIWIVIRDKVYDVTKFLSEHPGGEEVLIEVAGKEATKEFDDVGHSEAAIEQMASFYVGDIVDSEKKFKDKGCKTAILGASSAVAVGVGAFIIYQGYKFLRH